MSFWPGRPRRRTRKPSRFARYVPADGLTAYLEHTGFEAHPEAWHTTATYKMLNETSLGVMLKEVLTQLAEDMIGVGARDRMTGGELVSLLGHLAGKGFAVGICGDPRQPRAYVIVIRDALGNEVFRRVLERMPLA